MRACLLLLPLVLLLSACGGDALAIDPVAQAATRTADQGSEHMSFSGTTTVAGKTISITGDGDFRNKPQLGQMTMSYGMGGNTSSMQIVMSGWTIYMTSSLFSSVLPQGKTWMSLDLRKASKAMGIDIGSLAAQTPSQTLDQLKASGDVKKVGTETIDGVQTDHYRATLDLSKLPNGKKLAQLGKVTYQPADVWIGSDDGLVRRMHTAYSTATGGVTTTTDMTMSFSNYGESVDVTTPSAAQTLDATALATKGLKNGGSK